MKPQTKGMGITNDDIEDLYGGSLVSSLFKSATKAAGRAGKSIAKAGSKRIGRIANKGAKVLKKKGTRLIRKQKRHLIKKGTKLVKRTQRHVVKTIKKKAKSSLNNISLGNLGNRKRKVIGRTKKGQLTGLLEPPQQASSRYKSHHRRRRRRRRRTINPRRSIRHAIERGFIPDRGQISY